MYITQTGKANKILDILTLFCSQKFILSLFNWSGDEVGGYGTNTKQEETKIVKKHKTLIPLHR